MIGKAGIQGKMKKISDCSQKGPFSRQAIHCLSRPYALVILHSASGRVPSCPAAGSIIGLSCPKYGKTLVTKKRNYTIMKNQSSDVTGKDESK